MESHLFPYRWKCVFVDRFRCHGDPQKLSAMICPIQGSSASIQPLCLACRGISRLDTVSSMEYFPPCRPKMTEKSHTGALIRRTDLRWTYVYILSLPIRDMSD
ncbi:uncharacterized protein An07g01980 [Aspergillus niger]|uniref:Contig An07c0030, genomic contig n=2 Tax=Aspergillus niger TaxID=5061 RepID=A2QMG1_ASPNC|nr:uncharacterized protein An07g01980 [Aspergillus niger]CAK48099.1 unnamed protein product [Aspergillus niger]